MKHTIATYAILPILGLGLLGPGIAAAAGSGWFNNADPSTIADHFKSMFEHKAAILGISVDDVKQAWADGKTMKELMDEEGISEEEVQARLKQERLARVTAEIQALVDNGIITQAQGDARLANVQSHLEDTSASFGGHRGFRHGFGGFGFGPPM